MRKVIRKDDYKGIIQTKLVRHDDNIEDKKGKYHIEVLYNNKGVPSIKYLFPIDDTAYDMFKTTLQNEVNNMFKEETK